MSAEQIALIPQRLPSFGTATVTLAFDSPWLRSSDWQRLYDSLAACTHKSYGRWQSTYVAQQLGHSVGVLCSTYAGVINASTGPEKGLAAIQKAGPVSPESKN